MNRQYVGARYVPKVFNNGGSNEWVSGIAYEALTLVTYLNNGYTSIKPVPSTAGAPNVATEYWACTGNVSGAIGQIEEQVEALSDKVDGIGKRRFILISDSYGEVDNPWTSDFKSALGLSDEDCYISAVGGYGFKPPYNAYFITLLQNLEGNVSDADGITDIIVVGGFNDRSTSASDIHTAIGAFVEYANEHYPNAKVWVGGAGWGFNYEFCIELKNGAYLSAYKECAKDGAYYLAGIDYIMHDKRLFKEEVVSPAKFLTYNYVHPTDESSQMICDAVISNVIAGVPYSIHDKDSVTVTAGSNVSTITGNATITMMQDDGLVTVNFSKVYFYLTEAVACNSGEAYIELGTVNGGKIGGATSADCIAVGGLAMGFVLDGNNNNQYVPIKLTIANNRLYACVSFSDSVSVIGISGASFVVPITCC